MRKGSRGGLSLSRLFRARRNVPIDLDTSAISCVQKESWLGGFRTLQIPENATIRWFVAQSDSARVRGHCRSTYPRGHAILVLGHPTCNVRRPMSNFNLCLPAFPL